MIVPIGTVVGTSAVKIADVPPSYVSIVITNGGTATIFVGTSNTVTATNGAVIPIGHSITLQGSRATQGQQLWAISGSAAQTVGVFVINNA